MPTLQEVKKRIRSVNNIAQITRALEAVSASRVRRAQARALASRNFAEKAWEILINVQNANKGEPLHPLLTARPEIKKIMVVVITSDRGLAGAYNGNVIRVVDRFVARMGKPAQYITVGRKGRDSLIRAEAEVVAEFSDMPAEPSVADIAPIARLAIDAFLSGEVDEVVIAYTDFINMLTQRPVVLPWLPLTTHEEAQQVASEYVKDVPHMTEASQDYEYEPSAAAVVDEIVPRFTELQVYQALLESQASEHAACMAAMRNASENAGQLTSDLTLEYNKARQAVITAEILDIVGGANALQQSEKSGSSGGGAGADDLTTIEGIGPKMNKALQAAGITTFRQLANTDESALRAAIEAAGMRLSPSLTTWAEQAALAAKGDWAGLHNLQDELVGGRRL